MKNSRQDVARILKENDLMDGVKLFGENFGNDGKLPSILVRTKTEGAYYKSDKSQRR